MARKTGTYGRRGSIAAILLGALILPLLSTENSLPADAERKAAALPTDLAKIPTDGMLACSIRVADLWKSDLLQSVRGKHKEITQAADEFEKRFGLPLEQVERLSVVIIGPPPAYREPLFLVRTIKPYDLKKVLASDPKFQSQKHKDETLYVGEQWNVYPLDDHSLVYSVFVNDLHTFIDHPRPKERGALADAMERAAEKHSLVAGINVKQYYDSSEGNPLPPDAEPFRPLFLAQRLTLVADVGAESRFAVSLIFANKKDATVGEKVAQSGLDLLRTSIDVGIKSWSKEKDNAEIVSLLKQLQAPLQTAKIERQGDVLQASVRGKIDLAAGGLVLVQTVQRMRERAARIQSLNNLKQIILALHNYADSTGGRFPPQAVYSKDGKPLLSWRVMILPYLAQKELYNEFHLNESWDSEHNKKLLAKMPRTYAAPQNEQTLREHTTPYQGFVGKDAFFDGKRGLRLPADFPDGLSNTFLIVEASKVVPWTKPEDILYDAAKPVPKLGLPGAGGFSAGMGDGSVRFYTPQLSERTMRLVITRNDGQILGPDF